jgi:hypothetical protein
MSANRRSLPQVLNVKALENNVRRGPFHHPSQPRRYSQSLAMNGQTSCIHSCAYRFSFLLKTGRMADFRERPFIGDRDALRTATERRSPVTGSSRSAECGGRACVGAADTLSASSGILNNSARPNSRTSARYRSVSPSQKPCKEECYEQ